MRGLPILLVVLAATAVSDIGSVASAEQPPKCGQCVVAVDSDFAGIGNGSTASTGGSAGAGSSGAEGQPTGARPRERVVRAVAPICQGNSPGDGDALCQAALLACPQEGDIAYWVWRQMVVDGQAADPDAWVKDLAPPFVCIGPSDPVVDPRVAIAGIVQREFSSYDIFRGSVVVDPEGETLVGFPTRFWTDAREYEFTRSILGRRVVITARPVEFVFHFGDGEVARRSVAPRPGSADLVHDYAGPGSEQAYVVVTWEGSYVIEGSPQVLQVRGTATTTGVSTRVLVREARSQYEGG